jgi:hypothetical protein
VQVGKFGSELTEWAYSKGYTTTTGTSTTKSGIETTPSVSVETASTIIAGKNAVTINGSSGVDFITGSPKNDSIASGGGVSDSISAGTGNDTITLTGSTQAMLVASVIDGGTDESGKDNDILILGQAQTDFVDAGFAKIIGIETLQLTGASSIVLSTNAATAGITTVVAGAGNTSINTANAIKVNGSSIGANALTLLGAGDITASVGATATNINGTSATGKLILTGGIAVTGITGGSGADFINAAASIGATTITGGTGVDTMTGGTVADKFVFVATDADITDTTPTDVITNFVTGTDKLVLGANGAPYAAAVSNVTETASVTFSALTSGQIVTIEGITVTAPVGGLTQTEVATQFASLAASATPAGIVTGTFTAAGADAGWTKGTASGAAVVFTDANTTAPGTNVTDLAVSGTNASVVTLSGKVDGATTVREVVTATFGAMTSGQTFTLDGVTVTAPAGGLTGAEVVAFFSAKAAGAAPGDIVSGSMSADYSTGAASSGTVVFTSGTPNTNDLTDVAKTGTGTAVVTVTQGSATTAASGNYVENTTSVASIDALLTAAYLALDSTADFYFGVFGGNGYLVQDDDGLPGHTNLIKLNGVLDMAAGDIIITA